MSESPSGGLSYFTQRYQFPASHCQPPTCSALQPTFSRSSLPVVPRRIEGRIGSCAASHLQHFKDLANCSYALSTREVQRGGGGMGAWSHMRVEGAALGIPCHFPLLSRPLQNLKYGLFTRPFLKRRFPGRGAVYEGDRCGCGCVGTEGTDHRNLV
ncbi:hypothetical protein O3P69_000912 [Scylla paramamosain]|uniref:Uncharacterized protein n=1 Tax=Scylla paramamosain TaxID=85552 RepID=A0AAW0USK3_SCYPA